MFRRTLLLLALVSLLPVLVLAQEEGGSLAVDYWVTVNLNEALQWEEGLKQHLAWRREQADTWTWQTWQIVRGEELGRYLISSGGHTWADFDAQPLTNEGPANYMSHVGALQTSFGSTMSTTLSGLSKIPEIAPRLVQVYIYNLKIGKTNQFVEAIKRYHEAATKTDWPGSYIWIRTVSGGTPGFALVVPSENWAGFQPLGKTPEMVVEEAFGRAASVLLFEQIGDAVDSVTSELWIHRPELSYSP